MSECEKNCENCKWWDREGEAVRIGIIHSWQKGHRCQDPNSDYRLISRRKTFTSARTDCVGWQAMEPTEYRPGDGPFWASKDPVLWCVRESSGRIVVQAAERLAKRRTDELNSMCRTWADEHHKPRWIPVWEQYPDVGSTIVIRHVTEGVRLAEVRIVASDAVRLYIGHGQYASLSEFTHWMPLPNPPEDDEC